MSSYEADATYRLLLRRYEEKGFIKPEMVLEANITELVQKGRTREEAVRELHSSDSPWIYSPDKTIYDKLLEMYSKEYRNSETMLNYHIDQLTDEGKTREEAILKLYEKERESEKEKHVHGETEQQKAVLEQISNLREKIDSLTSLFSKGEITEETYLRGVKNIEENISKLQREHKIPTVQRRESSRPASFSGYARQNVRAETEETYYRHGSPSNAWYFVPFLFGILGGIAAYAAVKDEDRELADNLLIFGVIWTFVVGFLGWLLLLH